MQTTSVVGGAGGDTLYQEPKQPLTQYSLQLAFLQQQFPASHVLEFKFLERIRPKMVDWANSESHPSGPKRSTHI